METEIDDAEDGDVRLTIVQSQIYLPCIIVVAIFLFLFWISFVVIQGEAENVSEKEVPEKEVEELSDGESS